MTQTTEQVDSAPRKRPDVPVATGIGLAETARDHVLVLRPTAERLYPGKTVSLSPSGAVEVTSFSNAVFFRPLLLPVDGIDSLHAALTRVAEGTDGAGFVVRGQVWEGADPRSITRRKTGRKSTRRGNFVIKGRPRGLEDAERRWGVLDMDQIPNLPMVDPRRDPEHAMAFLRSLLPVTLQGARLSYQWSSSTALRGPGGRQLPEGIAPAVLGAHLRFWADQPMAEAEQRAMLKGICVYVAQQLAAMGAQVAHGVRYVDPSTATYSQPIYTLRPKFVNGAVDPFPGPMRYSLMDGGEPEVDVALLMAELPMGSGPFGRAQTPEAKAERARVRAAAVTAKSSGSNVIEFTPGLRRQNQRLAGTPSNGRADTKAASPSKELMGLPGALAARALRHCHRRGRRGQEDALPFPGRAGPAQGRGGLGRERSCLDGSSGHPRGSA